MYFICVFYYVLVVSHRCVSLLVRVWTVDVWRELVPSKIFNPLFPVLKAGHSVSYSCVCDVDREWVNGVGFFLNFSAWLVCYAHVFHVYRGQKICGFLSETALLQRSSIAPLKVIRTVGHFPGKRTCAL